MRGRSQPLISCEVGSTQRWVSGPTPALNRIEANHLFQGALLAATVGVPFATASP